MAAFISLGNKANEQMLYRNRIFFSEEDNNSFISIFDVKCLNGDVQMVDECIALVL